MFRACSWFFLLRSDESIGSTGDSGASANSFQFEDATRQVTVTLGVRKECSEGLLCRRTLQCCCPLDQPQSKVEKILPFCPYCSAKLLVQDSSEPDPNKPLLPHQSKQVPKSSQLLKRAFQGSVGHTTRRIGTRFARSAPTVPTSQACWPSFPCSPPPSLASRRCRPSHPR